MLFHTSEFIFLFLPLAVTLHFALARRSVEAAILGTTISSFVFYAFWNPPWVVLPLASILVNYWIAQRMVALPELGARRLLSDRMEPLADQTRRRKMNRIEGLDDSRHR